MTHDEQQALIEAHLEFAEFGARRWHRYYGRYIELEEFRSAAYVGLVVAARHFDPTRGVKFTTYAFNSVNKHLGQCWRRWRREHGWAYSPTKTEQRDGRTGMQHLVSVVPMPRWKDDDEERELLAAPADPVFAAVERASQIRHVLRFAETDRERFILEGLLWGRSFAHIASDLGVTRQRIYQLYKPVVKRVRKAVRLYARVREQRPA